MKSGKEIGSENVEKLRAYIDSIDALPARNGKVHVTAIAEAVGIDRQALYKNPAAKQLLEEAVAQKGLRGLSSREDQGDAQAARLEQKITELEQKNSALQGENYELRRQLAKLRHVESLLEEGKRVIP
jgi:transposase-like protein